VDGVAVVPDDERRGLERPALGAVGGDPAEEDALDHRRAGPRVLAEPVQAHAGVERQRPLRDAPEQGREALVQRLPEGEADEERREEDRAREQRVVEHRHLDDHAPEALGRRRGDLERRVGPQRRAPDHGLVELEVVHERDHLLPEGAHRIAPHVVRAVRAPVAQQVEQDHPVAAVGQVLGQRLVHARRKQQPGQEDDRARPAAVRPVREALALMSEARHGGGKDIRRFGSLGAAHNAMHAG
jgi:hypothetical protein